MTGTSATALVESYRSFYEASATIGGALIGLLFVAVSTARDRDLSAAEQTLHELRASAAFTAFSNTLVVSLFALMPDQNMGTIEITASIFGLVATARAMLVLIRLERAHQRTRRSDGGFVFIMALGFLGQLTIGVKLSFGDADSALLYELAAILVVIFFTTGIARAWQLIGGPEFSLRREAVRLVQRSSSLVLSPDPSTPGSSGGGDASDTSP